MRLGVVGDCVVEIVLFSNLFLIKFGWVYVALNLYNIGQKNREQCSLTKRVPPDYSTLFVNTLEFNLYIHWNLICKYVGNLICKTKRGKQVAV